MAVTRIRSISVKDSLSSAVKHRLSPPDNEVLITHRISAVCSDDKTLSEMRDILENSPTTLQAVVELFEYVESAKYSRKIRKNSVIQELLISYSKSDFDTESEDEIINSIKKDINLFFESFKDKFGFHPFSSYFIHKTDSDIYHVHILFSLMNYNLNKPVKVRWKKRTYFELVKKISDKSPRISPPEVDKGIGAYPLWLIRKLEKKYGRDTTKEIIKIAREKNYTTRDLIEKESNIYSLITKQREKQRRRGFKVKFPTREVEIID